MLTSLRYQKYLLEDGSRCVDCQLPALRVSQIDVQFNNLLDLVIGRIYLCENIFQR